MIIITLDKLDGRCYVSSAEFTPSESTTKDSKFFDEIIAKDKADAIYWIEELRKAKHKKVDVQFNELLEKLNKEM